MSSLMGNHGMALATATAMAVSGTVILMALCRPRPLSLDRCYLRPCITSAEKRRENTRKKKKRVRFGKDVVVEFYDHFNCKSPASDDDEVVVEEELMNGCPEVENARDVERERTGCKAREMPANRAALYSGILQDRLQRMACY